MTFFRETVSYSIDAVHKNQIANMAYDGCAYYFATCENNIIKTNLCFKEIKCFKTSRPYDCLCYDESERCFWAVSSKNNDKIFKLNCFFCETDCIELQRSVKPHDFISGISHNCCRDTLLFTAGGDVCETDKSGSVKTLISINQCVINCVASICPGYIISGIRNNQQFIFIIHNGEILFSELFDHRNIIKNIILNPCCMNCNKITFDLLIMGKSCNPHIIKSNTDDLGVTLCECNKTICRNCCHKKPCENVNRCADILESIALEEASLAYILNAEGEKLQKIIAVTDNIEDILCVNREVNKTIINVIHLEHVLYDKLNAVLEICDIKCSCGTCPPGCYKKDICECEVDMDEDK